MSFFQTKIAVEHPDKNKPPTDPQNTALMAATINLDNVARVFEWWPDVYAAVLQSGLGDRFPYVFIPLTGTTFAALVDAIASAQGNGGLPTEPVPDPTLP